MSNFSQIVRITGARAGAAATRHPMWRLVPLLAVLGCIEGLVPWPDVAALVLDNSIGAGTHAITAPAMVSAADRGEDRTRLVIQVRATSR